MTVTIGLILAAWSITGTSGELDDDAKGVTSVLKYQNYIGYEGIATLGSNGFTNGPTPPVGDYVTTHCRYIIAQDTTVGHYFLRYPIHLPHGAVITRVSLYVADFNPTGVIWASLRTRQWNSNNEPTSLGFTLTDNTSSNDKQVNINNLNIQIDNRNKVYWVDVSPENSSDPGQLCVYGIQVTYDCTDCVLFADGFESDTVNAWSSSVD